MRGMCEMKDEERALLLVLDDTEDAWSVEWWSDCDWCATVESSTDAPGWEIHRTAESAYRVTYEHGWYRQEGDAYTLRGVARLALAMVTAAEIVCDMLAQEVE